MPGATFSPREGGCTCGAARYRLSRRPMFVHCCHCRWCQRETGSAFAVNALVEAGEITLVQGDTETIDTPTHSGRGQRITRCPRCRIALWSTYSAAGEAVRFLRVGTLDQPDAFPPDIHLFTASRQPWVTLGGDAPVMADYYRRSEHWPEESVERYRRALGR